MHFMSSHLAQKALLFLDRVLVNTGHLADPDLSVMAQLHVHVAKPMTRYVRMESTRSPTRQFSDQAMSKC